MPEVNRKTKTLLFGTLAGALIGLGAALLLSRTAERDNPEGVLDISTGEALGVAVSIIGVVRGIAALGDSKSKKK